MGEGRPGRYALLLAGCGPAFSTAAGIQQPAAEKHSSYLKQCSSLPTYRGERERAK